MRHLQVQFFGAGGDCCWLISSNIVSWKEGLDKGEACGLCRSLEGLILQ